MNNKEWSEKILRKYDPSFKHRWKIYDEIVSSILNVQIIWIDYGCSNNGMIETYSRFVKKAVGEDIIDPAYKKN